MICTRKRYYEDMKLSECVSVIKKINNNRIELTETVAYPEGGGQEGDIGQFINNNGDVIPFSDAKKSLGRMIYYDDFPIIKVDTNIQHIIDEQELDKLSNFKINDEVTTRIDINRRERLTISHTASHLVYLAIGKVMPDALNNVKGCHITETYARFDFSIPEKFNPEHIKNIEEYANEYVDSDYEIKLFQHEKEPEAWYWECNNEIIPCGGTHLDKTGAIGKLNVRRKNLGKGKERVILEFPDAKLNLDKYHS